MLFAPVKKIGLPFPYLFARKCKFVKRRGDTNDSKIHYSDCGSARRETELEVAKPRLADGICSHCEKPWAVK